MARPKPFGNGRLPGGGTGPGDGSPRHPSITGDVEIRGDLAFSGRLEFDGRLEGNLRSGDELVVGESAVISGTVEAETADIAGSIQGEVIVAGRALFRPGAMVYGSVMAGAIVIEEGAVIDAAITTDRSGRAAPDPSDVFRRPRHRRKSDSPDD